MSEEKNTKAILWAFCEKFGNKIFTVITFFVLVKILDPKDFGIIAMVRIVLDYMELFIDQGIGSAVIQKNNINNSFLSTAFWLSVLSGLFVTVCLLVFAPYVAELMGYSEMQDILYYLALSLLISGFSRVHVVLLIKDMAFKSLAKRSFIESFIGGVVGIYLAYNGWGVWSLVWQQVVSATVGFIVLWFFSSWRPAFEIKLQYVKEIYSYCNKIIVEKQILFFTNKLDEILITYFLGTTLLGYYSIAKKLLQIVLDLILNVVAKVTFSLLSKKQDNKDSLGRGLVTSFRYTFLFVIPIFVGSAMTSKEIIGLWFGANWLFIADIFFILMISGIFLIFPSIYHAVYYSVGKPIFTLKLNTFRSIVGLPVLYIGAAYYGLLGVAVAVLIRNVLGSFADGYFIYYCTNVRFLRGIQLLIRSILLCIPMVIFVNWFQYSEIIFINEQFNFFLLITGAMLFYIVSIFLFDTKTFKNLYYWLCHR